MSETPQEKLERYLQDGGIITLPHIREAVRAVLAEQDRLKAGMDRCDLAQHRHHEALLAERDALRSTVHDLSVQLEESGKEERALREIMRRLVAGIDKWNASVTPIIGRPVDYKWPALEEARAALFPEEKL